MKSANLNKALVVGAAVVVLTGVAREAFAQYPTYPSYSYGSYYPGSLYGGYVNPQRIYDPHTNYVQPGSLQHIHRHLPGGRVIDGYIHTDAYGIPRFTGNSYDRFGNSSPIVTSVPAR